ncbi:conserved hypothetical protein [Formosa agariphila KMM 3901]|uniref:Outer membrane protein beta-barrel domain-containing protein n=1 Tax=Formosa agariphila (strain DSM 15362 / KCTC 12365 / LMG 23005 / KMM 3901 / M-2Alg 35-1) TaxID=1347342 RepID=T2KJ07_FORAG|nr:hypothetical protein [Formosa agariphila]CDF78418.1 conserved hypothetical protein [Formosa agariphila KMM 3901]
MKKTYISLLLFTLFTSIGLAQDFNVNLYGSYTFQDRFDSYYDYGSYYDGKIEDGFQWGAGLEFKTSPYMGVELLYLRQDTKAPTYYLDEGFFVNERFADFDLAINYVLIGGNRYFGATNSPLQGFGGLMAGMVIANIENPDNGNTETATKFAWGAKFGGVYWMNSKVGIKMQMQLLSAVQTVGGGLYFSGYGPSAGLSTYSTIYQFSLGGGLVFKMN